MESSLRGTGVLPGVSGASAIGADDAAAAQSARFATGGGASARVLVRVAAAPAQALRASQPPCAERDEVLGGESVPSGAQPSRIERSDALVALSCVRVPQRSKFSQAALLAGLLDA